MKLYRIWQDIYKSRLRYDSAVVCADSEEDARGIHPDGYSLVGGHPSIYLNWVEKCCVNVEYIGEAKEGMKRGVVVSSFNLGYAKKKPASPQVKKMTEEPDCDYKDKCIAKGPACETCKHNRGKRNYYEPEPPLPYIPYVPSPTPPQYYQPTRWKSVEGTQECMIDKAVEYYRSRGEPIPPLLISCPCPKCRRARC